MVHALANRGNSTRGGVNPSFAGEIQLSGARSGPNAPPRFLSSGAMGLDRRGPEGRPNVKVLNRERVRFEVAEEIIACGCFRFPPADRVRDVRQYSRGI